MTEKNLLPIISDTYYSLIQLNKVLKLGATKKK